jgi:hypothetical protein
MQEEREGNEPNEEVRRAEPEPEGEAIRSDRRRLLVAGLIAAPFMLTLAARPARAASGMGSLGAYDYGVDDGNGDDGSFDSRLDDADNRPSDRESKPSRSRFDN